MRLVFFLVFLLSFTFDDFCYVSYIILNSIIVFKLKYFFIYQEIVLGCFSYQLRHMERFFSLLCWGGFVVL